jgi:hypothetical protein
MALNAVEVPLDPDDGGLERVPLGNDLGSPFAILVEASQVLVAFSGELLGSGTRLVQLGPQLLDRVRLREQAAGGVVRSSRTGRPAPGQ